MDLITSCSQCGNRITLPASASGKKARCKACGEIFVVQAAEPEPQPSSWAQAEPTSSSGGATPYLPFILGAVAALVLIGVVLLVTSSGGDDNEPPIASQEDRIAQNQQPQQPTQDRSAQRQLRQPQQRQVPPRRTAPQAQLPKQPTQQQPKQPARSKQSSPPVPANTPGDRIFTIGHNQIVPLSEQPALPEPVTDPAELEDEFKIDRIEKLAANLIPSRKMLLGRREGDTVHFSMLDLIDGSEKGKIDLPRVTNGIAGLVSPDGKYMARINRQDKLTLEIRSFEDPDFAEQMKLKKYSGTPKLISFVDNEHFLFALFEYDEVKIARIHAPTGKVVNAFDLPHLGTRGWAGLTISPDGTRVALYADKKRKKRFELWDIAEGKQLLKMPSFGMPREDIQIKSMAISSDNKILSVMAAERRSQYPSLISLDLETGELITRRNFGQPLSAVPRSTSQTIPQAIFLPDSELMVYRTRYIFDARTGCLVARLGLPKRVTTAAITSEFKGVHSSEMLPVADGHFFAVHRSGLDLTIFPVMPQMGVLKAKAEQLAKMVAKPVVLEKLKSNWSTARAYSASSIGKLDEDWQPDPLPTGAGNLLAKPAAFPLACQEPGRLCLTPDRKYLAVGFRPGILYKTSAPALPRTNEIHVVDLVSGKQAGRVSIPLDGRLFDISDDGKTLLVGSGEEGIDLTGVAVRLDLFSIETGEHIAGFAPFADEPYMEHRRVNRHLAAGWARLVGGDLVLAYNGKKLAAWSISQAKCLWKLECDQGAPAISPGGKQLAVMVEDAILLVEPTSGKAWKMVAKQMPGSGGGMTSGIGIWQAGQNMRFSPDGKRLAVRRSSAGLAVFDLESGAGEFFQPDGLDISTHSYQMAFAKHGYLLTGQALIELARKEVVWSYRTDRDALPVELHDGRLMYLSRASDDQPMMICATPVPSDQAVAQILHYRKNPPLIRPGVRVGLRVSSPRAGGEIRKALQAMLHRNGHDGNGSTVATLHVSITSKDTGRKQRYRIMGTGKEETIAVHDYYAEAKLVANGKVLWSRPSGRVAASAYSGLFIDKDQTVQQKIDEQITTSIKAWGGSISYPRYITAQGKVFFPVSPLTPREHQPSAE